MLIGNKIIHLSTIDSTNNYIANEEIRQNLPSGTVVLADEQLSGKGQRGAKWHSERGKNLTFSFLLKDVNMTVEDQFVLNKLVALAVLDYLRSKNIPAGIKWPNDILVENDKIAGILIENSLGSSGIQKSIVGIGLNVNQNDFNLPRVTSMNNQLNLHFEIREVLLGIIEKINLRFGEIHLKEKIHSDYISNLFGLGEVRSFEINQQEKKGKIIGVNSFGLLEIEIDSTIRSFGVKEIKFLYK